MALAVRLQNSHQNGGRVFLIFVADPTTARWCTNRFRSRSARFGIGSNVGLALGTLCVQVLDAAGAG